jgi:hypothetical protein
MVENEMAFMEFLLGRKMAMLSCCKEIMCRVTAEATSITGRRAHARHS